MSEKTFEDAEEILEDLVFNTRKSGSSEMEVVHEHLEDLLHNARHDRESYEETLYLVECSLEELIKSAHAVLRDVKERKGSSE
jgi:hypothetical protein